MEGAKREHESNDERGAPPGQFVSEKHQADCLRFLEQVKELAQRRDQAGLGRGR